METVIADAPLYAGFGKRLYAYLIDQSIIQGVALVLLLPFGGGLWDQLSGALTRQPTTLSMQSGSFDVLAVSITAAVLFFMIFQFVLGVAYGTVMEGGCAGATWGKRYCGLRVTDVQGQRIGYGAAALRNAGINVLSVALSMDMTLGLMLAPFYLMPLFTKKKQALHDIVAQTIVVQRP
ncbi:MAG: RDD family protein [Bdellovibrionales bacterium]|jgi:uncharacterized RDD family membrane protein YckC